MRLITISIELIVMSISVHCEYQIKNDNEIVYLHRKFDDIKEAIFPYDLKVKLSLSRIRGTLLYSIDHHMNQLIISLSDSIDLPIAVRFNNKNFFFSLIELCGCVRCRYETIDLRVQIMNVIRIQCNGGTVLPLKYEQTRSLDRNYPIPYDKFDTDNSSPNEAHLWLVNTPQDGDIYPNSAQLSGCIFDVIYKNQRISFTNVTDNIKRKCPTTCTSNICNGGQCFETYNSRPVCNCTLTFMDGEYCNDTISTLNVKSNSQLFIFESFKVAWKSASNNLMALNNSKVFIQLNQVNNSIFLQYDYLNGRRTIIKSILSDKYEANSESILIAHFSNSVIMATLFNNDTWYSTAIIPTNRDLRREIFETLTLQSGSGVIDFWWKVTSTDYIWEKMFILNPISILNEKYQQRNIELIMNDTEVKITNNKKFQQRNIELMINDTEVKITNNRTAIFTVFSICTILLFIIVMIQSAVIIKYKTCIKRNKSTSPIKNRNDSASSDDNSKTCLTINA